ncbi:hypothetical protein [Streptomyces chattanoogensis]|uniref:hypothetical protein n=1 Tax=Streptomyces chattanoogensis TaxID=66876 RepID=UPI0036CBF29F
MPPSQSLTAGIHETILILPGGGIHAHGVRRTGPETTAVLIERRFASLCAVAGQQGRPIRLSVGHPDGRVEHHHIAIDGAIHLHQDPPLLNDATDPIWSQGIPEESNLLGSVRAAHRAGQWRAAQQAAHCATGHLAARHGRDHPYVAMGIELQAYFALLAEDLGTAAALYTDAAIAIHQLNGPRTQSRHDLANAVAAWLRSDRDTRPGGPGFAIAHALIRITPDDQTTLAAFLHRLTKEPR